jgi:tetratricopeptide (TPR) repeat protein
MTRALHLHWWILVLGVVGLQQPTETVHAATPRLELGVLHAREGRYDDAHRQFALVLANSPGDARALNNAANVYLLEGATDRALELYARAREAAPREPGILLNLGIAHHLRGDRAESLRWLREGMLQMKDPREAYFLLGLSNAEHSDRASEADRLQGAEIEALLDLALENVPSATVRPSHSPRDSSSTSSSQRDSTSELTGRDRKKATERIAVRAGGTRADQAGQLDAARLFWMVEKGD